ncbi:MAG: cupin domain-containing protein [Caldilineaceae bacterium]|nr:cupin domain-containing protein [Caldilineaceae bacterium]
MTTKLTHPLDTVQVLTYTFADDGSIPNHPSLPLILYKGVLRLAANDPASIAEELFTQNGWQGMWRNGIFDFHHYHSNAHEVLAICRGQATVRFGGEQGETITVTAGDVALLPAGTGHKRLSPSGDLLVVGAYPPGQHPDLCRGGSTERPRVLTAIQQVAPPAQDPVYGNSGPLFSDWRLR